ncbi:MAG: HAD-IA family hydrolase [Leptospirales bacterium]|nr:HAD-IA family hydrolase [Leptospirales bacterium]
MKLAFFDLDGTLEDSRQDMALSVNRIRSKHKLPELAIEEARGLVNRGMNPLVEAAFPEIIKSTEDVAQLRKEYEADYLKHVVDHTILYPGIADMLRELSKKLSIVIYTNKPEAISRELLKRLDVLQYVQAIIGGDSFPESKPSPGPMRIIAERLNLKEARAVMCGDTAADIQAARNYGADAVWCAWGYVAHPPEPAPDLVATRPDQIVAFVASGR